MNPSKNSTSFSKLPRFNRKDKAACPWLEHKLGSLFASNNSFTVYILLFEFPEAIIKACLPWLSCKLGSLPASNNSFTVSMLL